MLMLQLKKQQLAIDPLIETKQTLKNRPYKIKELRAYYRNGFTICIALVELDNGRHEAYEFRIEGFDMHDASIQKGIQNGTLCNHLINKIVFA